MSDALKRRCLHLWIDYPNEELELRILDARIPNIAQQLAEDVVAMMHNVRNLDLKKTPSISETLDWARALMALNSDTIEEEIINDTLNVILKYEGDVAKAQSELAKIMDIKKPAPAGDTSETQETKSSKPDKKGILH